MTFWWSFAAFAACIYCIARAIVDLRGKRYVWAAFGITSAIVLLLTPIQTHAVKIDLPVVN